VGFLIYVADSFGYLGSVLVMLGKEFLSVQLKWSFFYSNAVIWLSIAGLLGTILSFFYFNKKYSQKPSYPWTLVQPSSSVPE
jgi:hypothetical protein